MPQMHNLSTDGEPSSPQLVDEQGRQALHTSPDQREGGKDAADCWLGCVVPKRHARRAVTRNLMKRQIRTTLARTEDRLAPGLWLIRLRQGFASALYPSADSPALRTAVRSELQGLVEQMLRGSSRPSADLTGRNPAASATPAIAPSR